MKKVAGISILVLVSFFVSAQENLQITDTSIQGKYYIRNNLDGQKIIGENEKGTIYSLGLDNMPCIAADMGKGIKIPNAFRGLNNIERNPVPWYYRNDNIPIVTSPGRKPIMSDSAFQKSMEELRKKPTFLKKADK